jgi:hypothetical protein
MDRLIHETPQRVQVRIRASRGYVVFDWSSFSIKLDEIEIAHRKALAAAEAERCLYYIADTSKVRDVLPQEVIAWWGSVWVPKLAKAGLRAIVTVVPGSALASLSTRSWQAGVVAGITMLNAPTLSRAKAAVELLQGAPRHEPR